jgi:hypothetical protein
MKENQRQMEGAKAALEVRLTALPSQLQLRCLALEKQIHAMPTSLTVAGAQLRVMEAKMQEHEERYQQLQHDEQLKAAQFHKSVRDPSPIPHSPPSLSSLSSPAPFSGNWKPL